MTVSRTGSIIEINTTNENSSQSITVPDDATLMILGCAGYESGVASLFGSGASFTIGGAALTLIRDDGTNGASMQTALWRKTSPAVGSQTFAWNCSGAITPDYGFHFWIAFYKGTDGSTPIRSNGGEQAVGDATASTGSLNASSGDMFFGVANAYASPLPTISWDTVTEQTETTYNGERSGTAEGNPTAAITVVATASSGTNISVSGCIIQASIASGAPSYTTDLSIYDSCEAVTGWSEATGSGWEQGGTPVFETDYFIAGNGCIAAPCTKTGVATIIKAGSGITVPTDGAVFIWQYMGAPNAIDTFDNGGLRVIIGSGLAAFKGWKSGGKDFAPYPYGGWRCAPIDPTLTADYTIGGGGSGTLSHIGSAASLLSAVARGNMHGVDFVRYGRGESRMSGGESGNYATFAGFAAQNDSNRWGLIQVAAGGFLWQGLMTLGYSSAVDFRDSNTMIMIADTRRVTAVFNKIEIRQSGSRVDWTNINFLCLGPLTTASKGRLEVVDDCDVNLSGCVFTDMDTFIFKASSDILNCVFRRCNTITANNAKFAGTLFDLASVAADTSQLIWDVNTNPSSDLAGCTFTKGTNAHHAIEFGLNSPTSITLTDMTFTGFNASNNQNDSVLHIKRTSGTVTITLSGTNQPSYKSAGAGVEFVSDTRTVKVIVQTAGGTRIGNANVFLATAESGNLPYNASVTIDNEGTTATVSHTAHGMSTNDKVWIQGASLDANNGVFTITKINDNSYSYTMGSSPGSDPTGTITATFVYLKGLTDDGGETDGEISMQRPIPGTQLANGWARKSSSAPYYKTGPINGDVVSTGDTTFTAILGPDE